MATILLLALLVPLAQEDPQVIYREGLFEEVDQGNLDKAAELYAKVLKSGAPDALKAKALLRTGFCHEKKGKKKEAEQAWRDVVERFPKAGDAARIASERLTQQEGKSGIASDGRVSSLILDLGSASGETQSNARRTLLLLGDESVPQLQHALRHPDRTLSNNAARVLMDMGRYEGVYESIRRFWGPKVDASYADILILKRLLPADDAARRTLLKDVSKFKESEANSEFAAILCGLGEPEFVKVVEDWIVNSENLQDGVMSVWSENRPAADVVKLMKRLGVEKPPETYRICYLFREHPEVSKIDEAKAAVMSALTGAASGPEAFNYLSQLVPHLPVQDLVRGPFLTWFAKGSPSERWQLLSKVHESRSNSEESWQQIAAECRKVLFELMGSAKTPLSDKELILSANFKPDSPDEQKMYFEFCLQYWKENKGFPLSSPGKKERSGEERSKFNTLIAVMSTLAKQLPPDSRELPEVLDGLMDVRWVSGLSELKDRKQAVVAAGVRALVRKKSFPSEYLGVIQRVGNPEEWLQLGQVLSSLEGDVAQQAAGLYAHHFRDKATEEQWKQLRGIFDNGGSSVKTGIAQTLKGISKPQVDELMDAAARHENSGVRALALTHWSYRDDPSRLNRLIAAMKDPAIEIQLEATRRLAELPNLEAVPHLIDMLSSPSFEVREEVSKALATIKKHFEAQAEWKRWYDETKKALGK